MCEVARRRRGARGREQLGGMGRDSLADLVSLLFSPLSDDRLETERAGEKCCCLLCG